MPETKSVDLKCSKIGQSEIMQVSKETNSGKSEVPTHLQVLYDKPSEKLSENERKVLQSVLTDYEDVFAKHDLDIGCFEHFDHEIDTKDSKPIKQQIRRFPLQFKDEETSAPDLAQSSESFLTDLVESNSEPLCSNEESVELAPQPATQPSRTGRVRRRPTRLKGYFV